MDKIIMERLRLYEQHNYGESALKVYSSRGILCHTDELHRFHLFPWGGILLTYLKLTFQFGGQCTLCFITILYEHAFNRKKKTELIQNHPP